MSDSRLDAVRAYHERTKHHLDRYAAGPEYLDWDQQPNPFRRFADAPEVALPLLGDAAELLHPTPLGATCEPAPLDLPHLAALLELSLGLSAWKVYGPDRWALRCNPSSGNLHPTEGYVLSRSVPGLEDGLYHYAPRDHLLERRCRFASTGAEPAPQLLIGLTSIAWREAWKYGERAFRYVQLDTGHALGALRYAAAVLGWQVRLLPLEDRALAARLGVDRSADFAGAEAELAEMLVAVGPAPSPADALRDWPDAGPWTGRANALGGLPRHPWPIIEEVAAATRADAAHPEPDDLLPARPPLPAQDVPLARLIRRRRSAQAFDGHSAIPAGALYRILDAVLPRPGTAPWDAWPRVPRIHAALFVHRVEALAPGLYLLPRGADAGALRAALRPDFQWQRPPGCPDHLPLHRLVESDARKAARTVSCHQEIAAASAFSLGLIAEFDAALAEGPDAYRHLYWEAGLVGQVLYLEAEAAGLRGTGIGCFFDDTMHTLLGLEGTQYQSLYHFTVGHSKADARLQTLPAYAHLEPSRSHTTRDALKARIAVVFAQREALKEALARGGLPPRQGLARLEPLDRELSALDSAFKALWDAGE